MQHVYCIYKHFKLLIEAMEKGHMKATEGLSLMGLEESGLRAAIEDFNKRRGGEVREAKGGTNAEDVVESEEDAEEQQQEGASGACEPLVIARKGISSHGEGWACIDLMEVNAAPVW